MLNFSVKIHNRNLDEKGQVETAVNSRKEPPSSKKVEREVEDLIKMAEEGHLNIDLYNFEQSKSNSLETT